MQIIPFSRYYTMNAWRQLGISGKWTWSIEFAAGNASLKEFQHILTVWGWLCLNAFWHESRGGRWWDMFYQPNIHISPKKRLATCNLFFFQKQSFALFFQTRFCLTCFPPLSWVCTRLFSMVFVQKVIWVVVSNSFFFDFHPSCLVKWFHLMFASFSKWMDIQPPTTVDHHLQRTKPIVNKCQ